MKLQDLRPPEGSHRSRKRRGRGIAAGQGKTGGFGTKGAGSRSGRGGSLYFEGGQLPFVRRLAVKKGFRNINRVEYSVVNLVDLGDCEAGTVLGPESFVAMGLVKSLAQPVKVLGDGEVECALTVKANKFSKSAVAKIEAAGGTVEIV